MTWFSCRGLNELVEKCNSCANKWRFTDNARKCAVMIMDRKRTKRYPLQILYDSTPIPEAANNKHLGIIQSISGKYPYDIDRQFEARSFPSPRKCPEGPEQTQTPRLSCTIPQSFPRRFLAASCGTVSPMPTCNNSR
ncbi:hypothetical protein DPMN_191847 [Dreissena polymorpha]|uniref:Uncharacterized protein n=1 Tax=Dreissena polymorpha TaxID=45954 RepID=A0A9D3XXZ9_DREPO|nr:hypothetical protein DPMN_191847 [Dreissena polymorpha]